MSEMFTKLLETRITPMIEQQQPRVQAGFRKHYSTIDHLHTINQLIEKSQEYQQELHLAFIDYTKAFDSLDHNFMLKALLRQGIPTTCKPSKNYIIILKLK